MGAVPVREREEARRLLELVPDEEVATVRRMLAGLASHEREEEDLVLVAFKNAPLDDEEVTEEDIAACEEADRAIAEGRVYSHEEVMRDLGL